jgi:hypothetical protein
VDSLRLWTKAAAKLKIKKQPDSSRFGLLQQYKTAVCDIFFNAYYPNTKLESLSIFHNDFDCYVIACLVCRRKYLQLNPEPLHYKFDNSWFTLADIKVVLKLPPKIVKGINRTKTAPS